MTASLFISYNYLHYGIFIHSSCEVFNSDMINGKLSKFGQIYSPFTELENCFKKDANILNVFNFK